MTAFPAKLFEPAKRILREWSSSFAGAAMGLTMVLFLAALLIPDNREITAKEYRWLSEQVEAYPAIRASIHKRLSDDGRISNWDLHQIKKELLEYAKQALWRKLSGPAP